VQQNSEFSCFVDHYSCRQFAVPQEIVGIALQSELSARRAAVAMPEIRAGNIVQHDGCNCLRPVWRTVCTLAGTAAQDKDAPASDAAAGRVIDEF
jgi:hypothetical protein